MRKRADLYSSEDGKPIQNDEDQKDIARHSIWVWNGEGKNIALLFFLYLLQGIPLGLIASIPLILQNHNVSYKDQAEFSLVFWPFSLKLLWAPIVDSVYSTKIGRRKSWLVPVQYLIGFAMLFLSTQVDDYFGSKEIPNLKMLTISFFLLNFLAATQDIAVDGWALTMLHRKNIGYASTCNSVGQTAGYFLGYVVFIALESPDFCNKYLRNEPSTVGLLTLSGFLYFWGIIFLITTTIVFLFKREQRLEQVESGDGNPNLSIMETYKLLLNIFRLPAIRITVLVLLTCKIGFAASDSLAGLKLVEKGVPKAQLALLAVPLVPLQIILPLIISRYTAGPRPMQIFLSSIPYRLLFGFVYAALVWVTPKFQVDGEFSFYYYLMVVIIFAVHQITVYSMFVAVMAFFAKVSDPAVGGTYMTLLNTICNLGGNWPSTLALWAVDALTWKSCQSPNGLLDNQSCLTTSEAQICTESGGQCAVDVDGFYVESFICIAFGFLWFLWGRKTIEKLQSMDDKAWKVPMRS